MNILNLNEFNSLPCLTVFYTLQGFCESESNSIFAKSIKENFDFEPFGDPHSDRREAKGGSLEQKG